MKLTKIITFQKIENPINYFSIKNINKKCQIGFKIITNNIYIHIYYKS